MILQYLDTIIAFAVILLALSLMITILNQMISTLFGYRGTNLLWGVQKVLSTIDPSLAGKAKALATTVLTEPIISDSLFSRCRGIPLLHSLTGRWRLASAVSAQDLVHGLKKVADDMRPGDATTATAIDDLLGAVDPEAARKAVLVSTAFHNLAPSYAIQVDKILQQLGTSAQESVGQVEAWFNLAMDRSSQRFAIQMRTWTVVFAILLAFGAHLDTAQVLQQLWSSPEMRNNLVNSREAVLQEAAVVLSPTASGATSAGPGVSPQIVNEAMQKLLSQEQDAATALGAPPTFKSLDEATAWLRASDKLDASHKEALVAEYQNLVLSDLKDHADGIRQELAKSGFVLIPSPYPGAFHFDGWKNFAGILATAAFLSLGAPFWFNALKTLSNLRPLVAARQDSPRSS